MLNHLKIYPPHLPLTSDQEKSCLNQAMGMPRKKYDVKNQILKLKSSKNISSPSAFDLRSSKVCLNQTFKGC
jgi:hypothetical protein